MTVKRILALCLVLVMMVSLAACGSGDGNAATNDEGAAAGGNGGDEGDVYEIVWISRSLSDMYAAWCYSALQMVVEEQYPNVKISVMDMQNDYANAPELMENAISLNVDAIMGQFQVNVDISEQVQKAWDNGIAVICVNYFEYNPANPYAQVGVDDFAMGELIAVDAADKLPDNAKICVLNGPTGDAAVTNRRNGVVETLNSLRPDVEILDEQDAGFNRDTAMDKTEDWLQIYGDTIDGILCTSDSMALGAIEAYRIQGMDYSDKIFYGIDGLGPAVTSIRAGEMSGSVCKSAVDAVTIGMELFTGYVDGTYEIAADYDHPSRLINLEMVNADNVEEWYEYYESLGIMQ